MFFMFFMMICIMSPYIFMDVKHFISSDPLVTPVHIRPEWYFLFAYTILRSISSKIGGVVALVMSVVVLYFMLFFFNQKFRSIYFYSMMKYLFWIFLVNWLLLTSIGACVVEMPFSGLGMMFSFIYFMMILLFWVTYKVQDLFLIWL